MRVPHSSLSVTIMHAQPQLIRAKLEKLHPTQIRVGMREVASKRKHWGAMSKKARLAALDSHWLPAVCGAENRYYIVDHHHFGLALLKEEVKTVRAASKHATCLPGWCGASETA